MYECSSLIGVSKVELRVLGEVRMNVLEHGDEGKGGVEEFMGRGVV